MKAVIFPCSAHVQAHIGAMQHNNSTSRSAGADFARMGILEAIARRVLMTAAYNGQQLTLAPHALFARRGQLYASALNLTKAWRTEEDRRLGYFKVAGLVGVEVTEEPFEVLTNGGAMLPHAEDELLLAVA